MSRTARAGWALALLAWGLMALWLFAHPPTLGSDDALYLRNGLLRFSILDFSPQFPGYPGFVLMGRALLPLAGAPLPALALLGGAVALCLPPVAALVAGRNAGAGAALAALALGLAMPLLPALGLGLLTDGAGILFTLGFLALLPRAGRRGGGAGLVLAGACLGWAAACRPSDGALILGAAAGALAVLPRTSRAPLALGAALVVLPTVAGLLLIEPLYLSEAWRFVAGHALLWGKTPFAEPGHGGPGWIAVLAGQPGLALLLAAGGLAALLVLADARRRGPAAAAAATAFLAHAVWTAGFQNPENLRHLAPLLVLGPLLLCLLPGAAARGAALICLAAELAVLIPATRPDPSAPAPLAAAAAVLAGLPPDSAVATNLGVAVLREALPIRVYDSYYAADAALGLARAGGVALRLTATEPATALRVFAPRFLGERGLWLVCARSPCAAGG